MSTVRQPADRGARGFAWAWVLGSRKLGRFRRDMRIREGRSETTVAGCTDKGATVCIIAANSHLEHFSRKLLRIADACAKELETTHKAGLSVRKEETAVRYQIHLQNCVSKTPRNATQRYMTKNKVSAIIVQRLFVDSTIF